MVLRKTKKTKKKSEGTIVPVKSFYKTAIGTLGLDPEYFLDIMSLEAFKLASEGYYERNKDEWERTRIIAYNSIAPHLKNNTPIKQFMPFEWDTKNIKNTHTDAEASKLFDKAKV